MSDRLCGPLFRRSAPLDILTWHLKDSSGCSRRAARPLTFGSASLPTFEGFQPMKLWPNVLPQPVRSHVEASLRNSLPRSRNSGLGFLLLSGSLANRRSECVTNPAALGGGLLADCNAPILSCISPILTLLAERLRM